MKTKFQPDQYHTATPYLTIRGAARALEFYKAVFGARERFRIAAEDGRIGHAEIEIGDSVIMLSDEYPEMGMLAPEERAATPVSLIVYVENCDEVYDRAVQAGAQPARPIQDMFYGDRTGAIRDPFGHQWHISTHIEDVAPDELMRRAEAAMKQPQKA